MNMSLEIKNVFDDQGITTAKVRLPSFTEEKFLEFSDLMFENFEENDVFVSCNGDNIFVEVNSISVEDFKLKLESLKFNGEL